MKRTRHSLILLAPLLLSACAEENPPANAAFHPERVSNNISPAPADHSPSSSSLSSPPANNPTPAPVYRPPDERPVHDAAALARQGIHRVDSKRLVLYSDLPKQEIAHLPGLVDKLYQDWIVYFGELPPQRDGGDYQITGYLMEDEQLFRQAGLLPEKIPYFEHGLHRGRRFWMRAQSYNFYQEHLLLHEATHCFMMELPGSVGPVWYMEGMAEYFGLHRRDEYGEIIFGAIPPAPEKMLGFDRIQVIRDEIAAGNFMTLDEVAHIRPGEFTETRPYAWSWATCLFFNRHPSYQEQFHALSSPALRSQFQQAVQQAFADDAETISVEWARFVHEICPNYDFARMTIEFPLATELTPGQSRTVSVAADHSWQPTGVRLLADRSYTITAGGEVSLADEPRPWISRPQGVSFDYAHAAPIGRLQAAILVDDNARRPDPAGGLLSPIDIGVESEFVPSAAGQLYLRINDHPDNLANNRGSYTIQIQ